jgi:hypothetical protein
MHQDDPVSVFHAALRSVVGWTLVIFATMLCGLWLGTPLARGKFESLDLVFGMLILSTFAWLVFPEVVIGFAVSGMAWYLPLRFESTPLRIGAGFASFVAWFALGTWVFR